MKKNIVSIIIISLLAMVANINCGMAGAEFKAFWGPLGDQPNLKNLSDADIANMLELPIFGSVPYDPEVRKSFMQEKVSPVMVRKPDCPAAVEISKIANRMTGIKVTDGSGVKKRGFFSRLFSVFRKK